MYIFHGIKSFTDVNYWDEEEILSDYYQRPYQYLIQLSASKDLDRYNFENLRRKPLANGEVILNTVLKYEYTYN